MSDPTGMKRGPKKTGKQQLSPALRLLHGTRKRSRHEALNAPPVPAQVVGALKAPRWLSARAKDFWHAYIRPRQFAEWQEIDAVQYCVVRASWEAQWQKLEQEETVLTSCSGTQYLNPRAKLVGELAKELGKLTERLGLDQALPVVGTAEEQAEAKAKSKARFFG